MTLKTRPFQNLRTVASAAATLAGAQPAVVEKPKRSEELVDIDEAEGFEQGNRRLCAGYTRSQGEQILKQGSVNELTQLRVAVIAAKDNIQTDIDDENATMIERRTELIEQGVHPAEAAMRAEGEMDQDWLVRAKAAQRILNGWLNRISARLGAINDGNKKKTGAVVIRGVGKHATQVSTALNVMISKGAQVYCFCVVGDDLVVVGTDPSS